MTDAAPERRRIVRFEVREVIRETADAVSLVLGADDPQHQPLAYLPGQFLTLRIPRGEGSVARCYSLSSSPYGTEAPKVTVKRIAGGYASNWIYDNVKPGMRIDALAPAGVFVPQSLDDDLLLIAGGSGITPVIAILKSALLKGSGHIALLYSNYDESSVIFAAELRALAAAHPRRLTLINWFAQQRGLITQEQLQALTAPYRSYAAFICGPTGLMEAARAALLASAVPAERINIEVYKSLSGDPFVSHPTVVADEHDTVQVEIEFFGATHRLRWPANVTLLDLMLSHGLEAPYLCREGACGTCTCMLERGNVRMLRDEGVNPGDAAMGYVLACQSLHTGVDAKIVF